MIAVGLPRSAQQNWFDKLPKPVCAWPAHYCGLSSHMKNFEAFIVGNGMCSCDLFTRGSDEKPNKVYEKYRKKGWSKTKIERAIANRKEANLPVGLHPELRRWLADAASDAGEAFVFVHWDSDELTYEHQISMSPEEIREQTVPIKYEQLIYIKGK